MRPSDHRRSAVTPRRRGGLVLFAARLISGLACRSAQPGTSYSYRVRAHDNAAVSGWSNEVSGETSPAP
jgi:hypothetical protein